MLKLLLALGLAAAVPTAVRAAERVETAALEASLSSPADARVKATALIFIGHDCPISNALLPELNRIAEKYAPLGVRLVFVYAESDLSAGDAARHASEFRLAAPFAIDPERRAVTLAGVKVTPEAAVFSRTGEVIYRGRINDLFPALGQRREQPAHDDLRLALDAILAGRAPVPATMPAIGCFIAPRP